MGLLKKIMKDPILYLIYAYGRLLTDDVEHDKKYLEMLYKHCVGKKLNLNPPVTFNEKMQWLKLYNRNPEYTMMVDKYEVKKYVAAVIGEQHVIPTLGVWDHFDEIDFDSLPNQFVLKCTHDSGGLIICKDKSKLNKKEAKRKIEHCLGRNYFYNTREWPYKNVKPRIIAERYMEDESGFELKDYKVQNFNGQPKMIQVDFGRFKEHKRNLYTTDWGYIKGSILYPTDESHIIDRPKCLDTLLTLASKLSKGIPYVRTDFYIIEDQVYFGELTFQHGSGFEEMNPEELNLKMGNWLKLPNDNDYVK